MNKILKHVLSIIVIVATVYYANKGIQSYLGKQAIGELPFTVHTLASANSVAESEGKLVLANYSAVWCPTCRKLNTQVFADARVAALIEQNFVFAKLEYDTSAGIEFAEQHNLVGFPRVLVLDTQGKKLSELPLSFSPADYQANLSRVIETFN